MAGTFPTVPPVLANDRLRLRRSRAAMFTDGATTVRRMMDRNALGEAFDWAITAHESDRLIGHVYLGGLTGVDDTAATLGYAVHPDSRGRGVMTDALKLVAEWAFRPVEEGGLGRRRLSLRTAGSNVASRHAAERAGFVHVATEPEAFPTGESGFEDSLIYHRLNPDWTP